MASKQVKNIKDVSPGCIILFFDKKTRELPGAKTGCNQIGVLISDNTILFCRKRKLIKTQLFDLKGKKIQILGFSDKTVLASVLNYFRKTESNYRLFKLGIRALNYHNMRIFDDPFIMPKFKKYDSDFEYQESWNRVCSKLENHDLVFTYDSKSLISKIIAMIDKGSWSHCGIYRGNGVITESIAKGVVNRSIKNYNKNYIHFGIYRDIKQNNVEYEKGDRYLNEIIGYKYGFYKALALGIRTIFGFTEDKFSPTDLTPNATIYCGDLYLVDFV